MPENQEEKEPSFAELFEAHPFIPKEDFRPGDVVKGEVVKVTSESVFVDLGGKSEGVADVAEFLDEQGNPAIAVGDRVELKVASVTDGIFLSKVLKVRGAEALDLLRDAYHNAIPVEGRVTGVNKGGLDIDISGIRAFCPVSQIDLGYCENAEAHVGSRYTFRIIEFKEKGKNLIVSRRALLEEEREKVAQETMAVLRPGLELEGRITRLTKFGAFVDIGGVEGMVHVSEIAHQRVTEPSDLLHVGQTVKVAVGKVEPGSEGRPRIALSMKALEPTPWEKGLGFREGQVMQGKVSRIADFGAFVELAPGIEGLVHISEISYERIHHPKKVLQEGQEVDVRILGIDHERQRISLSIKEALGMQPEGSPDTTGTGEEARLKTGAILNGIVERIKPNGLILRLPVAGPGIKGFLAQEDIGPPEKVDLKKKFPLGTTLQVEVTEIDANGRIRLSMKAMKEREDQELYRQYAGKKGTSGSTATLGDLFKDLKLPTGKR